MGCPVWTRHRGRDLEPVQARQQLVGRKVERTCSLTQLGELLQRVEDVVPPLAVFTLLPLPNGVKLEFPQALVGNLPHPLAGHA